jgi:CrcB protein
MVQESSEVLEPPPSTTPTAGTYLAVAIGGALGGYLRVGLDLLPDNGSSGSWPWITFAVNVVGTFALALTIGLVSRSRLFLRPLVALGFCGALTTFSTLQLELFRMLRAGNWALGAAYLAISVAAGIASLALGVAIVNRSRR